MVDAIVSSVREIFIAGWMRHCTRERTILENIQKHSEIKVKRFAA